VVKLKGSIWILRILGTRAGIDYTLLLHTKPMILNQRNKAYSQIYLAPSKSTLQKYGCTTLSFLEGVFRVTGVKHDPIEAVKHIKYTKEGLIIWTQTDWLYFGVKFLWRYYRKQDISCLPKQFRILQVNNGKHWVLESHFGRKETVCSDPYGRSDTAKYGYTKNYETGSVLGYALFGSLR